MSISNLVWKKCPPLPVDATLRRLEEAMLFQCPIPIAYPQFHLSWYHTFWNKNSLIIPGSQSVGSQPNHFHFSHLDSSQTHLHIFSPAFFSCNWYLTIFCLLWATLFLWGISPILFFLAQHSVDHLHQGYGFSEVFFSLIYATLLNA